MPTTFNLYDTFRKNQIAGAGAQVDLTGTLKIMFVTSSYIINQNTHVTKLDITNEVSGTGYTARGNACGSPTLTMNGSGLVTFDATDPATWSQNAGGFINGDRAIAYFDTGSDATSKLVGYSAGGSAFGNVSGDLSVAFDAAGIFTGPR